MNISFGVAPILQICRLSTATNHAQLVRLPARHRHMLLSTLRDGVLLQRCQVLATVDLVLTLVPQLALLVV